MRVYPGRKVVFLLASVILGLPLQRIQASDPNQAERAISAAIPINVANQASRYNTSLALSALDRSNIKTTGFGLKYPAIVGDVGYTSFRDSTPTGLSGDEWNFHLSADADVCEGLIAGVAYGYVNRNGNGGGTGEDQSDNTLSLYVAKRFADLVNVGGSFAYVTSDHKLSGGTAADLDSESYGVTGFAGVSKAWDKLSAAATLSLAGNHQDVDTDNHFDTVTGILSGALGYRVVEKCKASLNVWYNHVLVRDTFPGATPPGRDSWIFGPKLDYDINDRVSVNLGYNYSSGPNQFSAHTVNVGGEFRF